MDTVTIINALVSGLHPEAGHLCARAHPMALDLPAEAVEATQAILRAVVQLDVEHEGFEQFVL